MDINIFDGQRPANILKSKQKFTLMAKIEKNLKNKAIKEQENLARGEATPLRINKTLNHTFTNRQEYIIRQSRKRREEKTRKKQEELTKQEEMARQEATLKKANSNKKIRNFYGTLFLLSPSIKKEVIALQKKKAYKKMEEEGKLGCFDKFVHGVKKTFCSRRRGGTRSKRSQRKGQTRKTRK